MTICFAIDHLFSVRLFLSADDFEVCLPCLLLRLAGSILVFDFTEY